MSLKLIILFEKDVNLRHSIALILQRAGYAVTATDCIDRVIELIQSQNYRLVISDIDILETRSILLPKIQDLYPAMSVVIFTDRSISEIGHDKQFPRIHYLEKPVAPERLLDCIWTILGRKNHSDSNKNSSMKKNQKTIAQ
jgi:DNA-binding NtrC family response regulator